MANTDNSTRQGLSHDIGHYQAVPCHIQGAVNSEGRFALKGKCCVKYKVRWFSSKRVLLILVWNIIVTFSTESLINSYRTFTIDQPINHTARFLANFLSFLLWGIISPFAGWLADFHLGTYRVAKIGVLLLFFSTGMNCVLFQLVGNEIDINGALFVSLFAIFNIIGLAGQCIVLVTLMNLGLHQMPDASTDNITSFIVWFVCSFEAGYLISNVTSYVPVSCMEVPGDYVRIWTLFPVVAVSAILISDYCFASKWLIIEPKSPQSLKSIYYVLKFAAKHKVPLRRSAFTYWEEGIPSRMDLGKSKYGGPFSTEEVEDVKTVFRLLVVSLPIFVSMYAFFSMYTPFNIEYFDTNATDCEQAIVNPVVYHESTVIVLGTIVFEFLMYPLVSNFLPNIMKRIGVGAFLVALINMVYLVSHIVSIVDDSSWHWLIYFTPLINGVLKFILLTSTLELVIAQSPYKMRGLCVGYLWCLVFLAQFLYLNFCNETESYCLMAYVGVFTLFSIVGFALYCILARWYKRRVREDIPNPHMWAEDYYDRYLQ